MADDTPKKPRRSSKTSPSAQARSERAAARAALPTSGASPMFAAPTGEVLPDRSAVEGRRESLRQMADRRLPVPVGQPQMIESGSRALVPVDGTGRSGFRPNFGPVSPEAVARQRAANAGYEQSVRDASAKLRSGAQTRIAAAEPAAAPAPAPAAPAAAPAAQPKGLAGRTMDSLRSFFPGSGGGNAAAAPAAQPKGVFGRTADSVRSGASGVSNIAKASVPTMIGAGAAYVANKLTPNTPQDTGPIDRSSESALVSQIPTESGMKAPPKQPEVSPLGIGPNNEFTRNVANAMNAFPGAASLSGFRAGSNAARATSAAANTVAGVRGAQMTNASMEPPPSSAAPTAAAAPAKTFDAKNPQAYDDSKDFPMAPASTGFSKQAEGLRNYLAGGTDPRGKLPQDLSMLQEGSVYKTMDSNGRPVYSGVNVRENANIVNERGMKTGQLGGLETYANGTSPAFTPNSNFVDQGGFAYTPSAAAGGAGGGAGGAAAGGAGGAAPQAQAQGMRQMPAAAQMSQGVSDQVSGALQAAAARGDWDAVRNYYQSQNGGTGTWQGRTAAQDAAAQPAPVPTISLGSSWARDLERRNLRTQSMFGGNRADAMRLAAMDREDLEMVRQQGETQRQSMKNASDERTAAQTARAAAAAASAKGGLSQKDMMEMFFKERDYQRNVTNDRFAQAGQTAERDRERRKDTVETVGRLLLTPEMKDGKPTGKMVQDPAALADFQKLVQAKFGKSRMEDLDGEQLMQLAQEYQLRRQGIDRMNEGQGAVDPSLRRLGSRPMEALDYFKKGKVGALDVANGLLNPFSSKLAGYTAVDPATGQIRPADEVYMRNGQVDVPMMKQLDPELAAMLGY